MCIQTARVIVALHRRNAARIKLAPTGNVNRPLQNLTLYYGEGLVHGCLRARGPVAEVDRLYETLLGYLTARL